MMHIVLFVRELSRWLSQEVRCCLAGCHRTCGVVTLAVTSGELLSRWLPQEVRDCHAGCHRRCEAVTLAVRIKKRVAVTLAVTRGASSLLAPDDRSKFPLLNRFGARSVGSNAPEAWSQPSALGSPVLAWGRVQVNSTTTHVF